MRCPACDSEMEAVDSFVAADNFIEVERTCPNCPAKYSGVLYPVRPKLRWNVGGCLNESSDN